MSDDEYDEAYSETTNSLVELLDSSELFGRNSSVLLGMNYSELLGLNSSELLGLNSSNGTDYVINPPHQFPKDMLGFTAACAFIIAILGASGNLLTIFALPMCRKLRTTATAFVVNLAVVELLFCIFILPMSGAQYAYLQFYDSSLLSDGDCVFFAVARYTFTQVQLQTIVGIALTRAIAVSLPRLYQKINNPYVIGVYISLVWIYSLLLKLPTGLGIFGSYVFNPKTMECDMSSSGYSKYARFIAIIVEVMVPIGAVLLLYTFIFIMVKKSSMRVRSAGKSSKSSCGTPSGAHSSVSDELPSTGEVAGGRKNSTPSLKTLKRMMSETSIKARFTRRSSSITHCINTNRRDMRVARTIFIIFLMIIGFSVPVGYIHAIDSEGTRPNRFLAVHILYWLQYCLNVVVYVLLNRQYRDAYIECLARLIPGWERHKGFAFPWETPSVASKVGGLGNNSSFKAGRKDSVKQDSNNCGKESKPMLMSTPSRQGRLSAIPELNSSSVVSNDEVFLEDKKEGMYPKLSDHNDNKVGNKDSKLASPVKDHSEKGNSEERQVWLSKNGTQTFDPPSGKDDVV